ncbi:MAG TPA: hypothetical protein VFC54_13530 [Pseudolabrys sp.]|nr:hypothetical protein [Pseudolabrys sp.]
MILSPAANAQATTGTTGTTTNSTASSGRMWGSAGPGSASDSSNMHANDASYAGLVAAARQGLLVGGAGYSITSIGSQSIVSTTIIGDSNSTNVTATQTSTNSGAVSTNGSIAIK